MKKYQLASGKEIELDDRDFRSILFANRERAMRMLGVRKGPPQPILERGEDEDGKPVVNVRLRRDGESSEET